ncbi:hypothetical protein D1BOALGB6SA_6345 [Olavius sp. associated proteobacterium Delta 1]|nr:hypothetical protein D1BOALGB6SA_6345 [Olavius sp. associated proteobacterium Delta 1]
MFILESNTVLGTATAPKWSIGGCKIGVFFYLKSDMDLK